MLISFCSHTFFHGLHLIRTFDLTSNMSAGEETQQDRKILILTKAPWELRNFDRIIDMDTKTHNHKYSTQ